MSNRTHFIITMSLLSALGCNLAQVKPPITTDSMRGSPALVAKSEPQDIAHSEQILTPAFWQELHQRWQQNSRVKKLANGFTVVLVKRPNMSPVFNSFLAIDIGGATNTRWPAGLAHMLEHMLFKGTAEIGVKDYKKEKALLAKMEKMDVQYQQALARKDPKEIETWKKRWSVAFANERKNLKVNEVFDISNRIGGVDTNAFTNSDITAFTVSAPVNQLARWAYVRSELLLHPELYQFYTERDVVMEEKKRREDTPYDELFTNFYQVAYKGHPYERRLIGSKEEIEGFSKAIVMDFFQTYYRPENMTLVIVGNIDLNETMSQVEHYFGRLKGVDKALPHMLNACEEEQQFGNIRGGQYMRRVYNQCQNSIGPVGWVGTKNDNPMYMEGYHHKALSIETLPVYDLLSEILCTDENSILYKELVTKKKVATSVDCSPSDPGDKFDGQMFLLQIARSVKTPATVVRQSVQNVLDHLIITDEQIKVAQRRIQMRTFALLQTTKGLAKIFGTSQLRYQTWDLIFKEPLWLEKVSTEQVNDLAHSLFIDSNRVTGWYEMPSHAAH